jgi:hypothetical protein
MRKIEVIGKPSAQLTPDRLYARAESCAINVARCEPPSCEIFAAQLGRNMDAEPDSEAVSGLVIGVPGFEPGTSCPPDKRANQAAPHPVSHTISSAARRVILRA